MLWINVLTLLSALWHRISTLLSIQMVDMHLFCVQSKETDIESRAQRLKGYIICLLASIKNSKRIKKRVNSNSFEGGTYI